MRRIIGILSLVLMASCCAQHKLPHSEVPGPSSEKVLTLGSYNVGVFGKYMDDSCPEVVQFLQSVKADAVCMNELDSCNTRHNEYQLKRVAQAMGWADFHFAKALDYAGGSYGEGVLTREHIKRTDIIDLPKFDGAETRCVAVVETDRYILACTHLDHRSEEAAAHQAALINEWFTKNYSGSPKPVFLTGDMNALPESNPIKELEKRWTRVSTTDFTFSTKKPSKCIDYIFFLTAAKSVTVRKAMVCSGEQMVQLSDHFPTMVEVSWL